MPTVRVKLSGASYPIVIGTGRHAKLPAMVKRLTRGARIFTICDPQVYALHGRRLARELRISEKLLFVLPHGETAKSDPVLRGVYEFLLSERISREDVILACGGGVTTDLAGYAAATVLRGVRWGAVPTTLLGMVDAAIGGKTGINHTYGKNLIGAIWQPSFVSCDVEFLQTLPRREMVAGCGELLKYAGLMGEPMLGKLDKYLNSNLWDTSLLLPLVHLAAKYKAEIVGQDEREAGIRAYLNLGHTFGHAIERTLGYGQLLHGEAVILGLCAALALSERHRPVSTRLNERYRKLIESGMTLVPKRKLTASAVIAAMALDKKRSVKGLRFVLLERPAKPYITSSIRVGAVTEAVEEMIAMYKQLGGTHGGNTNS